MIRIGAGFRHQLNCLIHVKALLFHQQADEFRDDHGRMRIVDLNLGIVGQPCIIIMVCLHLPQNELGCTAAEEILLINSQQIAVLIRIVRIQEERQILIDL